MRIQHSVFLCRVYYYDCCCRCCCWRVPPHCGSASGAPLLSSSSAEIIIAASSVQQPNRRQLDLCQHDSSVAGAVAYTVGDSAIFLDYHFPSRLWRKARFADLNCAVKLLGASIDLHRLLHFSHTNHATANIPCLPVLRSAGVAGTAITKPPTAAASPPLYPSTARKRRTPWRIVFTPVKAFQRARQPQAIAHGPLG
jgi:hypothetical protein